jgi:hypothetical protein
LRDDEDSDGLEEGEVRVMKDGEIKIGVGKLDLSSDEEEF